MMSAITGRIVTVTVLFGLLTVSVSAVESAAPGFPPTIRVAACQILNRLDMEENTARILHWIEVAAQDNVDVVLFPEAALTGYVQETGYYDDLNPEAVAAAEERVIDASRRFDIAVVLGTVHWGDDRIYNNLLAIDKGGAVLGRYNKSYLAEPWSHAGTSLPVYSLAGVESCFVICHDIRYPELVRLPAIRGARICYFSSHESGLAYERKLSAYRAMPIARATENTIYLVMANAPASSEDLSGSHGNSKIIHPDGNIIVEAGYFDERLVTATIDINRASRKFAKKSVEQKSPVSDWLRHGSRRVSMPKDE